jgi:hypothetical protein
MSLLERTLERPDLEGGLDSGCPETLSDALRMSAAEDSWLLGASRRARSNLILMIACGVACGGHAPVPAPGANSQCVQGCQASHAVCIQSSNVGAGGYGDARAALIGGLISMAASSSARGQCADVLRDCYATCGQSITPQQQQQQALDDLCRQLRCADGQPGGWIGKAGTLGREVLVALQLCRSNDTHVVGSWGCAPLTAGVECVTTGGPVAGVIQGNELKMASEPLPGGRVRRCEFTGRSTANLTLEGNYVCAGSVRVEGQFIVSRCAQ